MLPQSPIDATTRAISFFQIPCNGTGLNWRFANPRDTVFVHRGLGPFLRPQARERDEFGVARNSIKSCHLPISFGLFDAISP